MDFTGESEERGFEATSSLNQKQVLPGRDRSLTAWTKLFILSLPLLLLLALATITATSEQVTQRGAHAPRSQRITSSLPAVEGLLATLGGLWTLVR